MGFLDLHWKGKSKAAPSSTSNSITNFFSRTQQPPSSNAENVQTSQLGTPRASSSASGSSSRYPEPEQEYSGIEKNRPDRKYYRDEKRSITCGHKINCGLNTSECCACLDRRPLKRDYFIYKDGRGLVAEGTRWGDYCPGCKAYWTKRQGKGIPAPSSPSRTSDGENSKIPLASLANATSNLKPEQQQQSQSQGESNDPPPPSYSSTLSDGWEILPRYQEGNEEYGSRS